MKTSLIKIRTAFGVHETQLTDKSVELTGRKGTGKSSVLDAIRYALTNRSDRDYVVKQGADEAEIIIETDTGLKIDRKRKDEISATSEKLKTLKSAQDQVKAQYKSGGIDSGQYRAFQRELESTKQKLSSLKDEKSSTAVLKAAFGEIGDKIKDVTDKLQPLVSGLGKVAGSAKNITSAGIQTVEKAVGTAGEALKKYAATAGAAGAAVTGLAVKGATAADDINTISAQTGLSTDQIQKFQYATELIDVPLDTLTGSMAKLTRNMQSAKDGSKNTAAAFQALGVNITDQNGQLRDNQDVFNDAIAALSKMPNETQRDAYAMQIFGKSAEDLNPLIKGGADKLKELGDSAQESGMILSGDALNHLNEFRDSMDILKANASQSGNVLAGVFSGSLKSSTDLIGKALPGITGALAGMFSGAGGANAQQQLTTGLVSLMQGLVKNISAQVPLLMHGLNQVIIAVLTAVGQVLQGALNTLIPILINGFTGLIMAILPQVPVLLPIIVNAALQLFTGLLNGLNLIIPPLMAMLPELINNVTATLIANLPTIINGGFQLLIGLIQGITNCIPQLIQSVIALIPVITQGLLDNLPALVQAGVQLIIALAQGLPQAIPAIIRALPAIIGAIINAFGSVNWIDVGIQVLKGIAEGLVEGVKAIGGVIKNVASSVVNGFKSFFGIHSPSTLFRDQVGKNLAAGIGEGFGAEMDTQNKKMQAAVNTSFSASVSASTSSAVKSSTAPNLQFKIPVYFNGQYQGSRIVGVTSEQLAQAYSGREVALGV